jgi:hypothetical protein
MKTWGDVGTLLIAAGLIVGSAGCYAGIASEKSEEDGPGADSAGDDAGDSGEDDTGEDPEPQQPEEECVDTRNYFEEEVWRPVLQADCFGCHNPEGQAKDTDLVLQGNDYPGYLEANYNTVQNVSRLEIDGTSLMLLKPTNGVEHGGAVRFADDSDAYAAMEEMISRFDAPVHCVDDKDIEAYFKGLVELDEEQTLRKATFLLASRYPTPEEYDAVRGEGIDSLDAVLDEVLNEEAFYVRIKEIYNDMLHTDALLETDVAIDALDEGRFPMKRWYEDLPEDQQDPNRDLANDAVAKEPLHIIEHVLREGRPFTEILTGDWTIVNPYSARSYGIELGIFEDQNDPDEWVEYSFEDIPQAGVLSTPAFLSRYPSTTTNRNRHRSRIVYDFFFATDVMRLAARPIDVGSIADFNPTLYNPQCTVCHENIDPLAGAFQNWNDEGHYDPPEEGWFPDMSPPGFADTQIPFEEKERALQWLTEQLVLDDKFAIAVVQTLYTGLTGHDPLLEPLDADHPDYVHQIAAFEAQDYSFKQIAREFADSGYELRVAIKGLVKTPWFRAVSLDVEPGNGRAKKLAPMGTARLLSPEALDRRIQASIGFAWERNGTNVLMGPYRFFYGGIDSIQTTTRLTDLNGVMANIAERMANEVSCQATAFDFTRPVEERMLFPMVETTDLPGAGDDAILENIQYLHRHLLGEALDRDDPELHRTFEMFKAVQEHGSVDLLSEDPEYSINLPNPCQATTDRITGEDLGGAALTEDPDYTVRAWMAVVSYLLGDFAFLYE